MQGLCSRDGEPVHGQGEQAVQPHTFPTPNSMRPAHISFPLPDLPSAGDGASPVSTATYQPTRRRLLGYSYRRRNGDFAPVPPGLVGGYGSVPARKMVPSCALAPRGRTRNTTSCPLFIDDSIFEKSSGLLTGCLFTSRTTSPRFKPRSSANDPCFTSCTTTPLPAGMFRRSARSEVMLRTVTPNLLAFGASSLWFSSSSPRRDANNFERSAMVTVASCFLPLRTKASLALEPGLRAAMSATSSSPLFTSLPSTEVMVSPIFRPASSAGLPETTFDTVTPDP